MQVYLHLTYHHKSATTLPLIHESHCSFFPPVPFRLVSYLNLSAVLLSRFQTFFSNHSLNATLIKTCLITWHYLISFIYLLYPMLCLSQPSLPGLPICHHDCRMSAIASVHFNHHHCFYKQLPTFISSTTYFLLMGHHPVRWMLASQSKWHPMPKNRGLKNREEKKPLREWHKQKDFGKGYCRGSFPQISYLLRYKATTFYLTDFMFGFTLTAQFSLSSKRQRGNLPPHWFSAKEQSQLPVFSNGQTSAAMLGWAAANIWQTLCRKKSRTPS